MATLLDDIQEHSEKLPELPELRELRETAQKFVGEVRGSGAVEAMTAAEQALAEFAPTRGYEKAKEAADILAKFLKRCHGMGNCADGALRLQPSLCQGMGNTVAQLLAGMGMGQGGGGGMGMSDGMGMGGYSSVGLYGGSPETFGAGERGAADSRFAEGAGASRRGPPAAARTRMPAPATASPPDRPPARARARSRPAIAARWDSISAASPRKPAKAAGNVHRRDAETRRKLRSCENYSDIPAAVGTHFPLRRDLVCGRRGLHRADARQSGGEPDGVVQVANLVYAGTKSSRCFSDHFLIEAEKKSAISTSRRFHAVKLASDSIYSFRW